MVDDLYYLEGLRKKELPFEVNRNWYPEIYTIYKQMYAMFAEPYYRWRFMNETFTMSMDKLIDRLAALYHSDCVAVAKCCDEVLDRSGALLGYVREHHNKLMGLQTQPTTAACNGEV